MQDLSKKNSRYLYLAITCFLVVVLARIYYRTTDDFRMGNILYKAAPDPRWELPPVTDEEAKSIERILNQPFGYLGKGSQCYVFASGDERYVLKFFKFKHLTPSLFVTYCPHIPPFSIWQQKEIDRKNRKLNSLFSGYHLGWNRNREESGLVFIKLNPTSEEQNITVIDKLGLKRTINLGEVVYLIQEKGKTLEHILKELLDQGKVETAKQRIDSIIQLYRSEYAKGIYDTDRGVMNNTGFVGERAIHIDIGKLTADAKMQSPQIASEHLKIVLKQIRRWIDEKYPELTQDFAAFLEQYESNSSMAKI